MESELLTRPQRFGDRLWKYKWLRAEERRGMIPKWFYVWYGLDRKSSQIMVRTVLAAPGSPLSDL
jgi:hypothetical protein